MRCVLLLGLLAAVAGACRPAPSEAPRPAAPAGLEDLAATGYAGWVEEPAGEPTGVRIHDPDLVEPGVTLYADERSTLLAVGADGRTVRRWRVPNHDQCEVFRWLEPDGGSNPGGGVVAVSVDQGVTRLSADGELLWQVDLRAHHDVEPLPAGGFVVPEWEEHPDFHGRRVRFDSLVFLADDGRVVDRWSTYDHRAELREHHPAQALDEPPAADEPEDRVYDYYHLNAVRVLPATPLAGRDPRFAAGNLLVCLRNPSLVVVLDARTRRVLWSYGPGELDFPHTPTLTPDGTLLVFDNGYHRGWSRVLELDPLSRDVVWTYEGTPRESFFTRTRGSSQRLPGGNTLICESARGRAFEVTPAGRVVWEFRNPLEEDGRRRRIYRVERVPSSPALSSGGAAAPAPGAPPARDGGR